MPILQFLVFMAIMYFLIRPIYGAYFFVHPPRLRISLRTPADFAPDYEHINLVTPDHTDLDGWYLHSKNGAAVILLHGHGGNRLGVIFHAEVLARAGYGVLFYDLRAHGASGGKKFTRGDKAPEDVLTAVAFLSKRPDVKAGRIGVMGVSVGGMLALHAAARTVAIHAVAADGPGTANLADLLPPRTLWQRLWLVPFQRFQLWLVGLFARVEPLPPNREILPRIAPRALLLIATGRGLERELVQRYQQAAGETAQLWELPEARHAAGWLARPEAYAHRMLSFFNEALLPPEERPLLPPLPESANAASGETAVAPGYELVGSATISMAAANIAALLLIPIAGLLTFGPFLLLWPAGERPFFADLDVPIWTMLLIFVVAIVVHELLHGIGFVALGGASWRDVKFGFSWKGFAPYAHCRVPLAIGPYRWCVLLPGLVLGVVPALAGLLLGSLPLVAFAFLMLVAAAGDIVILAASLRVPAGSLVQDHPSEGGCLIVRPTPANAADIR